MKSLMYTIFEKAGINSLYRRYNKHKVNVLCYHGIVKDSWSSAGENYLMVKESDFRKQMCFLDKHYDVIPLTDIDKPAGSKSRVVLTFDDGFANNYHVAYPILKELNLPATIFVITNRIGSTQMGWSDKIRISLYDILNEVQIRKIVDFYKKHPYVIIEHQVNLLVQSLLRQNRVLSNEAQQVYGMLTHNQIKDMYNSSLISFGSHTLNHENLTKLSDQDVESNIRESFQDLSKIVNPSLYFCYPYGVYKRHYNKILQKAGYVGALTGEYGTYVQGNSLYEIKRLGISRNTTVERFSSILSGSNKMISKIKNVIKG